MEITIDYEASWRNSFLDGNNNEPLPKKGRDYIASSTTLKKDVKNFIHRDITLDTVMGVLNRLIGDQRKLYQARATHDYFFKDIESLITFEDKSNSVSSEVVYLRNMNNSYDQNSIPCGAIKSDIPAFCSDYSPRLWSILFLNLEELISSIVKGNEIVKHKELSPLEILGEIQKIEKLKPLKNEVDQVVSVLESNFPPNQYREKNGSVKPIRLYCGALYLQLNRLKNDFDMSSALTAKGVIQGFSKRGFNGVHDFMNNRSTSGKKLVYGNPYIKEGMKGEKIPMLTKASGKLIIKLDIPREKAREIESMIDCAGVSSFYLGKKGLAYVSNLR